MNLFQLVLKQMRQRSLSTTLTLLSVLLGVGLAISILLFQREGEKLFGQSDFGYDVLIGPKGPKLQLVVNTAYHMSESSGTIPYSYFEAFPKNLPKQFRGVKWKVPFTVGDNYKGLRLVGTLPTTFLPSLNSLEQKLSDFSDLVDGQNKPAAAGAAATIREFAAQLHTLAKERQPYDAETCSRLERQGAALDKCAAEISSQAGALKEENVPSIFSALQDSREALRGFSMLGPYEYRMGQALELADGRVFYPRRFEAIVGADVPRLTGLQIGSKFKAEHGLTENPLEKDEHDEQWTVTGVLKKTFTANDRVIFIPLVSVYAIPEHEKGLEEIANTLAGGTPASSPTTQKAHEHEEAYELDKEGNIVLKLPKDKWRVSAIPVKSRGVVGLGIIWAVNNGDPTANAMAVNPASEMRTFFDSFLKGSIQVLLLMSVLVTVVAAVSILVSIYNSVSARNREIAILRALGATRTRVVTLICVEAGLVGLFGGIAGLVAGHLLGAGGSVYLHSIMGQGINYLAFDWREGLYLVIVVILAILAGFVPAMKAYRTPVAANLVAG